MKSCFLNLKKNDIIESNVNSNNQILPKTYPYFDHKELFTIIDIVGDRFFLGSENYVPFSERTVFNNKHLYLFSVPRDALEICVLRIIKYKNE